MEATLLSSVDGDAAAASDATPTEEQTTPTTTEHQISSEDRAQIDRVMQDFTLSDELIAKFTDGRLSRAITELYYNNIARKHFSYIVEKYLLPLFEELKSYASPLKKWKELWNILASIQDFAKLANPQPPEYPYYDLYTQLLAEIQDNRVYFELIRELLKRFTDEIYKHEIYKIIFKFIIQYLATSNENEPAFLENYEHDIVASLCIYEPLPIDQMTFVLLIALKITRNTQLSAEQVEQLDSLKGIYLHILDFITAQIYLLFRPTPKQKNDWGLAAGEIDNQPFQEGDLDEAACFLKDMVETFGDKPLDDINSLSDTRGDGAAAPSTATSRNRFTMTSNGGGGGGGGPEGVGFGQPTGDDTTYQPGQTG